MYHPGRYKEQLARFESVSDFSIYKPAGSGDNDVDFVTCMGSLMVDFVGLVDFDNERAMFKKGEKWLGRVGECFEGSSRG